jgi:hypothetical protein
LRARTTTLEARVARLERLHDLHYARERVMDDIAQDKPTAARQFVIDYAERHGTTYRQAERYLRATGRLE